LEPVLAVIGGVHHGQVASPSQGNTETNKTDNNILNMHIMSLLTLKVLSRLRKMVPPVQCFYVGRPLQFIILQSATKLAYKVLNGMAPIHLNALAKAYVTTRSLWLSKGCRLAVPTPRLRQSRLFLCVVPQWWNDLPSATRMSLSIFKKLLKT